MEQIRVYPKAKPHIHLLGMGDSPEVSESERRVGGKGRVSPSYSQKNI